MTEARGDSQQAHRNVADWLRRPDAEFKAADRAVGTPLEEEDLAVHAELKALGPVPLRTAAASVPIAGDDLPDSLRDRSEIAAMRTTLRTAARSPGTGATLCPRGWETSEWYLVVVRQDWNAPTDELTHELCCALGPEMTRPTTSGRRATAR